MDAELYMLPSYLFRTLTTWFVQSVSEDELSLSFLVPGVYLEGRGVGRFTLDFLVVKYVDSIV